MRSRFSQKVWERREGSRPPRHADRRKHEQSREAPYGSAIGFLGVPIAPRSSVVGRVRAIASWLRANGGVDDMTPAGLFYVAGVTVAGIVALAWNLPTSIPDLPLFLVLLVLSSLSSNQRLRLPLGSSSSTLSVSYATDFAALFLIGTDLTTIVAAVSAFAQSTLGAANHGRTRNPPVRVAFSVAALVLTVQAAGAAVERFGGGSASQLTELAQPMVAGALTYYLVNTLLVASAIAFSAKQSALRVWESNFLWTAPSYFVGAGAAVAAVAIWNAERGWLLPLVAAPVYLTFRSYGNYVDRINALEAAKRSEQRYALAAAGSNDGLWDWDVQADRLYCSERWRLMLGVPADRPVETLEQWLDLAVNEDRPELRVALDAHLRGDTAHFEHEYRARHADGEPRWVLCRGIAKRDDDGRPIRMAGSQTDVTEWRNVQDTLATAARHDHLTGLPNRRLFGELLQHAIAQGVRATTPQYAVLFIDLDGFKLVNDSLGHVVGDQFLVAIALRLGANLRPGDALARLGGDEFAVLIESFASQDEVCVVAERLQRSLTEPIAISGRELYASASIGIVLGGPQYHTVDDVLRDADIAMYRAKSAGRGGYQLFDPMMHASAVKRLTLETELRQAIERNEFSVFYQPIVSLPSSEITGLEALARWTRSDGQSVSPVEFIPAAEETGLIVPLTGFVLREACQQAAAWQRRFGRPIGISVNISSRLFGRNDFVSHIETALAESNLGPGTLRLEITESTFLNSADTVHENFERLRAAGVSMYLDDFGTGYSSLSYLQRYRVDALKLDRSFVAQMGTPDADCAIADAIVKLAGSLGMDLIAEGVENLAHAEHLIELGCPHAQGHFFSAARSSDDTEALLASAFGRPAEADDLTVSAA
jgi:diguanylate cyclase (GGDEF)-like protein/PAS domain S-box-containing protein